MMKFLQLAALLGVSMLIVNESPAKPGPSNGPKNFNPSKIQFGNNNFKVSLQLYKGNHHRHWSSCLWDAQLQCYLYWDPINNCYYYWYAPAGCFYPFTYVSQFPPILVQYQAVTPGSIPLPIQTTSTEPGPMQVVRPPISTQQGPVTDTNTTAGSNEPFVNPLLPVGTGQPMSE